MIERLAFTKSGNGAPKIAGEGYAGEDLAALTRYRRAANYLAAAQIYLKDNVLLAEPLRPTHVKDRLLGHWGTAKADDLVPR